MKIYNHFIGLFLFFTAFFQATFAQITLEGELKKWHKLTLEIEGPSASETGNTNPFLDYKLTGIFTQGSLRYEVPGYFAADGNAAETSATSGNVWRIHFAPPTTGDWEYTVRFREGDNVAVADAITAGTAVSGLDNANGTLTISNTDKTAPDLRAKGRLEYVGEHHLRFAETGQYFMKAGPDSPENFLAYDDIDNTPNYRDFRKSWAAHVDDWNQGDPTWQDGKGRGIIGAINYLAEKGLNTFSFLTMNIEGDDQNVFPYVSDDDFTRMDCSKLDQWEIIFAHGERKGMHLHFKMQEQENDRLLNSGNLGNNRKLYYRELIARYAHHMALNWNLGEENRQSTGQQQDMAQYMHDTDPYQNHVVLHTSITAQDNIYNPLLGSNSELSGISLQTDWNDVHFDTQRWVAASAAAGKKWVIANDEQGPSNRGVPIDNNTVNPSPDGIRQQTLWGNIMAGGAGVEYYFGFPSTAADLTTKDYRTRDLSWDYCRYALEFCNNYIPFWEMSNANSLSSDTDDYVLAKTGDDAVYVIYLPEGGSTNIDLRGANGDLEVKWYNPRSGGSLQDGSVTTVTAANNVNIGTAPNSTSQDWVVLIRAEASEPCAANPAVSVPNDLVEGLTYTYFEGNWDELPNFTTLTPLTSGLTQTVDLSVADNDENFGLTFEGYINIAEEGEYTFYTTSDDGSGLWINDVYVVNNDGIHGEEEVSGTICLEAGYHSIRIEYFERTGGDALSAAFSGPSLTKTALTNLFAAESTLSIDVNELSFAGIDIFPNPFTESLSVNLKEINEAKIEIFNAQGQLQLSAKSTVQENNLDVSHLATGFYLLKISGKENQSYISKLIKIE